MSNLSILQLLPAQLKENSRTCKDLINFQGLSRPGIFVQIQGLSRIFKDRGNPDINHDWNIALFFRPVMKEKTLNIMENL